jgi:hypothetical protein
MSTRPVTLDFSTAEPLEKAPPVTLDFSTAEPILGPGEQTNELGNKVIVPAEGESFADTMKRAATYGKTVTPRQINQEMATAPRKAAQVLAAAPLMGAVGAGSLAAPGELISYAPAAAKAIQEMAKAHPFAAGLVKKALYAVGAGAAYKHHKWLMDLLP